MLLYIALNKINRLLMLMGAPAAHFRACRQHHLIQPAVEIGQAAYSLHFLIQLQLRIYIVHENALVIQLDREHAYQMDRHLSQRSYARLLLLAKPPDKRINTLRCQIALPFDYRCNKLLIVLHWPPPGRLPEAFHFFCA
ncbi:hypothetical protein D3C78_1258760 [compost metagenome]